MNDDAQDILKTQFESLPKDIQGAITSVDLRAKLKAVADKHRLHLDQAGALENETVLVMLGLEHPRDYIRNLEREARVDAAEARGIAEDINKEVFRPIRESLKKLHGIGESVPGVKPAEAEAASAEPLPKPERKDFFKALREKTASHEREAAPMAPAPAVEMERAITLPVRREETRETPVEKAGEAPVMPEKKKEPIYPLSPVTAQERIPLSPLPKTGAPTPPNLPLKEKEAAPSGESPFKRAMAGGAMPEAALAAPQPAPSPALEKPARAEPPPEAPMIYPRTMRGESGQAAAARDVPREPAPRGAGEAPARGIVEEKLSAPFRMPGEERKEEMSRESRHPYEGGDPYREPVN